MTEKQQAIPEFENDNLLAKIFTSRKWQKKLSNQNMNYQWIPVDMSQIQKSVSQVQVNIPNSYVDQCEQDYFTFSMMLKIAQQKIDTICGYIPYQLGPPSHYMIVQYKNALYMILYSQNDTAIYTNKMLNRFVQAVEGVDIPNSTDKNWNTKDFGFATVIMPLETATSVGTVVTDPTDVYVATTQGDQSTDTKLVATASTQVLANTTIQFAYQKIMNLPYNSACFLDRSVLNHQNVDKSKPLQQINRLIYRQQYDPNITQQYMNQHWYLYYGNNKPQVIYTNNYAGQDVVFSYQVMIPMNKIFWMWQQDFLPLFKLKNPLNLQFIFNSKMIKDLFQVMTFPQADPTADPVELNQIHATLQNLIDYNEITFYNIGCYLLVCSDTVMEKKLIEELNDMQGIVLPQTQCWIESYKTDIGEERQYQTNVGFNCLCNLELGLYTDTNISFYRGYSSLKDICGEYKKKLTNTSVKFQNPQQQDFDWYTKQLSFYMPQITFNAKQTFIGQKFMNSIPLFMSINNRGQDSDDQNPFCENMFDYFNKLNIRYEQFTDKYVKDVESDEMNYSGVSIQKQNNNYITCLLANYNTSDYSAGLVKYDDTENGILKNSNGNAKTEYFVELVYKLSRKFNLDVIRIYVMSLLIPGVLTTHALKKQNSFFSSIKMSQITMIYNSQQWNQLVQSLREKNTNSKQEIVLPTTNIQQKNSISIKNDSTFRLDEPITDGIPQNIQFNLENKGFFNNYNSNLSFEIPIKITGLPDWSEGDDQFDIQWKSQNIIQDQRNPTSEYLKYSFSNKQISIQYNIVLYDNYICLQFHLIGDGSYIDTDGTTVSVQDDRDFLYRLYKIPPTPAAYLDNVLLQKNNKSNNAFNDYYKDIFRKQVINNQLIKQDFTDFMQNQYAYVNYNQDININVRLKDDKIKEGQLTSFPQNQSKVKVLATYVSTKDNPITEIVYPYHISIPMVFFHPFFQMGVCTPMELLNDPLTMIVNFNLPIFTACYSFTKDQIYFENSNQEQIDLDVEFTGINNMKITLFKDESIKYNTIEQSKDGIYYIIYRNSDFAQYQSFNKYDNIVLQNVIPKLNSLDIIQLSLFDRKQYVLDDEDEDQIKVKQINNMDYWLGYSQLFSEQNYQNDFGQEIEKYTHDDEIVYQKILDQDITGLNTNYFDIFSQSDAKIKMLSLGDIQISIDNKNIIPYTYQTLEDIYKTNIGLYDIQDNKQAPNAHWYYPYYLKYYNTYMWKFDQKFSPNIETLQQPQFKGLTVSDAKSNIFCKVYNYLNYDNTPPQPITYGDFNPNDSSTQGFYNPPSEMLDSSSKAWIDQPLACEFIYYYSSLFMIAGGDLIQISEQEVANILRNVPFYNETDYKIAQALPLFQQLTRDEMRNEIMAEVINKIREGAMDRQLAVEEAAKIKASIPPTPQGVVNQNPTGQEIPQINTEPVEGQLQLKK